MKQIMLTLFRAPGGVISLLPCQAECPIGHLVICVTNISYSDGSAILDQLNNEEKEVDSEVIKTRKGRKKKTDNKTLQTINEVKENDVRDKRERLVACVLSGNLPNLKEQQKSGRYTVYHFLISLLVPEL